MPNKPRILVHPHTFPPDRVSTGYLYGDIVKALVASGLEVDVITTSPHYNYSGDFTKESKRSGLFRIRDHEGARVFHVHQNREASLINRAFQMVWFHVLFFYKAMTLPKCSVILTGSPPITSGWTAGLVAKLRGVKAVYNIQEIYPDVLVKQGYIKNKSLINLLKWAEKKTYDWSHWVVPIDETFAKQIKGRLPDAKVKVIPNFIDTNLYSPLQDRSQLNTRFPEFKGQFVVGYVGNMGEVQNWDALLEACELLKNKSNIHFWLVGGGPQFNRLQEASKSLDNLTVWGYQDREKVPQINARIDLHLISMNVASDYDGLPSKIFAILASARPLMVASNPDSPISHLMAQTTATYRVDRDSGKAMAEGILDVSKNYPTPSELNNARKFVVDNFSTDSVTQQYVELIHSLL